MIPENGENGEPLRGAIIGFGNAAIHAHLPAWKMSEHFSIGAVVEPDPERAEAARRLMPEARIFSSIGDLLADGRLSFIDICTPPCYHVDLVIAACKSGLHVVCEKPLAPSLQNLQEIQRIAEKSRRVVFTVNNWKYAPLWVKTNELIQSGEIGAIQSISLNVLRPPNSGGGASDWRRCVEIAWGGILLDHGWHNLYVILSLIQEPPSLISAKMHIPEAVNSRCEDTVDLTVLFSNAEANLHLTWCAPCRRNFGWVEGDSGTIFINDDHLILDRSNKQPIRFDFPEALSAGSHHPEWMKPVIDNFYREITNPQERGLNLSEAEWCTQLIELAYRSNQEASRRFQVLKPQSLELSSCA